MAIDYHQQIMKDSVAEFSDLIRQRRKLDKKIARLQKMVRWAAMRSSEGNFRVVIPPDAAKTQKTPIGFTDAVRHVLFTYRIWLSPVLVRDLLPTIGFDTDSYKQLLPSIHVILRRLVARGEALESKLSPSGFVYIWASGANKATHSASGADH